MFARTERLLLRPGWAEDAAPLAAAIGDEAILTKLAKAPSPYKLADAQEFLGYDRREGDADFLIIARTGGAPRLIGGVGLHPDGEDLELGYWIARPYWGLGFATEAARAVIDIARHTLRRPRLVSGHFIDNPASGRVLSKLGFKPTGDIVARFCRARGHAVPSRLFALDFGDADDGDAGVSRMLAA
ncbi:MAG: GNAT family N-acetyltransferase [Sphingomonadales bacterium]|nr:GNAT family N-acetyltransferase [Sphingomonadales bacterium]